MTTPVSEVARGRVRASMTPQRLVAASSLPRSLCEIVLDVTRRSRLWRVEKADIARELIEHFSCGLEAGRSPEQLSHDFGDPAQTALLLRRAAKRNRPWPWRAGRFALRASAITLLAIIALYGALALRFYLGRPGPISDYRPELNATAMAVNESDRAWPLYRQALLRLPAKRIDETLLGPTDFARMPLPGEEGWDQVEAWLAQVEPGLAFARQAPDKPGLGLLVGYPLSPDDLAVWPTIEQNGADADITNPDSSGMIGILLPHLGSMRTLAMALGWDVQRAVAAGDSATALADLRAIIAMSAHVRETPLLINGLVGNAIFALARDRTAWILAARPDIFTDEQWTALAHAMAAMDDRAMAITLSGERTGFKDILQRLYTDDGSGDGRLTPLGMKWLDMLSSWDLTADSETMEELLRYAGPAISAVVLGRRDMANEYERLMDMMETESNKPLWLREQSKAAQVLEGWMSSPVERLRRLPLCMLLPALDKAFVNAELSCLRRDAIITAIALELYRRKHDRWPATLAELVPTTMPALPIDRFDGQPLRYRLIDGRPVLYSVGTDREDDGGVPPPRGLIADVWVPPSRAGNSTIITADGRRVPYHDGDWILFPPAAEGPLKNPASGALP
jgi:hypothetical protein